MKDKKTSLEIELDTLDAVFHAGDPDKTYKNVLQLIAKLGQQYKEYENRTNPISNNIRFGVFERIDSAKRAFVFFSCLN
jgi:hypothetical protein